jgi:hypothetical protein
MVITHMSGHDPFWHSIKLKKVYNTYRVDKTMTNVKVTEYIPNFISKNKNITEIEFVKFLRTQKESSDYAIFDYLVRYYELEYDSNNNPIFTDEFPFDKNIKKEAFSIWCTDRMVRNHPDFKCFDPNYFVFTLQDKSNEYIHTDNTRKIKIDMFYSKLNICVEIDENHRSTAKENDIIKNAIMQQKGRIWIRLNYQDIRNGDITGTQNINVEFLNSIVVREYYHNLSVLIQGALISEPQNMQFYLLKSMKTLIKKEIQETTITRGRNLQLINFLDKYSEPSSDIKNDYNLDVKFLESRNNYLENLSDGTQFMDLMNFAQKPEFDKYGNKAVSWVEIVKTINLLEINYDKFRRFLYGIKAIKDSKLSYEKIYISWESVGFVIFDFAEVYELRNMLLYYYVYLEKNMKIFIDLIKQHALKTNANVTNFDICAKFQSEKQYAKFLKEKIKLSIIESTELADKIKLAKDKIISKRDYKIQQQNIEINNLEKALAIKKFVEAPVKKCVDLPDQVITNFSEFTAEQSLEFTSEQIIDLDILRINNQIPIYKRSADERIYEFQLVEKAKLLVKLPNIKSLIISKDIKIKKIIPKIKVLPKSIIIKNLPSLDIESDSDNESNPDTDDSCDDIS